MAYLCDLLTERSLDLIQSQETLDVIHLKNHIWRLQPPVLRMHPIEQPSRSRLSALATRVFLSRDVSRSASAMFLFSNAFWIYCIKLNLQPTSLPFSWRSLGTVIVIFTLVQRPRRRVEALLPQSVSAVGFVGGVHGHRCGTIPGPSCCHNVNVVSPPRCPQ